MAPNTLPAMAKSVGQLRQLAADQDGSARRRLRRRHRARRRTATSAKAAARTSSSSATASSTRRRSARRSSAASRATRSSRSRATSASTVREADAAARVAVHRRRGVLRRHRRRGDADPLGRQDQGRRAAAAARSPRRCSSAFFDVINGEVPDTHGWLHLRVRRRAPARRPLRSSRTAARGR